MLRLNSEDPKGHSVREDAHLPYPDLPLFLKLLCAYPPTRKAGNPRTSPQFVLW
jgi:hypothetical protein